MYWSSVCALGLWAAFMVSVSFPTVVVPFSRTSESSPPRQQMGEERAKRSYWLPNCNAVEMAAITLFTLQWPELVTRPQPYAKEAESCNIVPNLAAFLRAKSLPGDRRADSLGMALGLCHMAILHWGAPGRGLSIADLTMPSINVFGALPETKSSLPCRKIYLIFGKELIVRKSFYRVMVFCHAISIC